MDNSFEFILKSKLPNKIITLKYDPLVVFQNKNYNELYEVEALKKFINLNTKEINFSELSVQDSTIHNILLFFTLFYTDFNINKDFKLEISETDIVQSLGFEENLKLFENFEYKDFLLFKESLIKFGLKENNNQDLLSKIKNVVLDNSKNKIWILFSPSKIFWTKSEKDCINLNKHDLKLNNFSYIYFNHSFCEKLIGQLVQHSRVRIGLMNSMNKVNLEKCSKGLFKTEKLKSIKIYNFDQTFHKDIGKNQFVRNFDSIMDKYSISETQLVCIESEMDKNKNIEIKGVPYDNLAIKFNVFDENYYTYSVEKQKDIHKEVDNLANFLMNLVENCVVDVREYIKLNKK